MLRRFCSTKIYVDGINWKTDATELRQLFEKFGTIEQVSVGKFATIAFSTFDQARLAITKMNGQEFSGRVLSVDFREPKDPARKSL